MTKPFWIGLSVSEKIELIKRVYSSRDSALDIAKSVSREIAKPVTRNTIIGLYTRNKSLAGDCPLQKRPEVSAKVRKEERQKVNRLVRLNFKPDAFWRGQELHHPISKVSAETSRLNKEFDSARTGIPFSKLEAGQCKFPLDDRSSNDHLFCGEIQSDQSTSYCDHHYRRARRIPS